MHRHGYKGRKFHRERDQRRALIKGLAESLVRDESIETTLPKAKELVPYTEKLVTKAKKGDLANRRRVVAGLQTVSSAHKLVDEIAPKLSGRTSGHLRITKTSLRRGDNAQMAKVSFVDDLSKSAKPVPEAKAAASESDSLTKTTDAKVAPKSAAKESKVTSAKPASKGANK